MDEAIEYFSDMFGFEYLSNYVGEITFFKRLPSIPATGRVTGLLARPSRLAIILHSLKNRHRAQDLLVKAMLPLLREKCQALKAKHDAPRRYADEQRKTESEAKAISQTLGVGLLECISATLDYRSRNRWFKDDRQTNIYSMVQEIKALQAKLVITGDEDELRALEEDIAGKILWLCWCGINSEVNEILPKVRDYVLRDDAWQDDTRHGLYEAARILKGTPHVDPDDDQAHLRRIMADAGAGTSKYQLLLAARAADQRGNPGVMFERFTKGTHHPVSDSNQAYLPRITNVDGVGTSKHQALLATQATERREAGYKPMRARITAVDRVATSNQQKLLTARDTEYEEVRDHIPAHRPMSGATTLQRAIKSRVCKQLDIDTSK